MLFFSYDFINIQSLNELCTMYIHAEFDPMTSFIILKKYSSINISGNFGKKNFLFVYTYYRFEYL